MADHRKWTDRLITGLRVAPGTRVRLPRDFDPRAIPEGFSHQESATLLAESLAVLTEYQTRLAAQHTYGVLLVLQALDAAGKDGTIKHVMSGVNPQGVSVHSFKQPSDEELMHDFLWRYQRVLPERGRIGIFNRSHYEEVLVVRVHPELLARQHLSALAKGEHVWRRRFREINDWELYLHENGIRVVKVFLNVSKEEQRRRFLERIDSPEKNWKFSPADVAERRYWDQYQEAFSEMLTHTSTEWAPWHVVPADRKWFTRVATAALLVDALLAIDPRVPEPDPEMRRLMAQARAELEAEVSPSGKP